MNFFVDSTFTINWATLVSLLLGMVLGVVLFVLIYVLITLKQVKKSTYTVTDVIKEVDYEEVKKDIDASKKELLIRKEEKHAITFPDIREIVFDLMKKTAKRFYPDSKEPLGELTLEELVLLDHYIIGKIEQLFQKRLLKPLKKISLNKLLTIINTKNAIENNKVVKGVKNSGIKSAFSAVYSVVKIINPVTWFNRLIYNPIVNQVTKQICLTMIDVIGQETYHVYSKQAFLEPVNDEELDKLLKEISTQYDEEIDNNSIPAK